MLTLQVYAGRRRERERGRRRGGRCRHVTVSALKLLVYAALSY
jgi:hypothetical protein